MELRKKKVDINIFYSNGFPNGVDEIEVLAWDDSDRFDFITTDAAWEPALIQTTEENTYTFSAIDDEHNNEEELLAEIVPVGTLQYDDHSQLLLSP